MGVPLTIATEVNFVENLYRQFGRSAHLQPPKFSKDKVLINLQNGTFEITTQGVKQMGFSPDDFLTYQLPFEYYPTAECPIFMRYLNRVLPDQSSQAVLAEFCGLLFIRNGNRLKIEKCLVLYGKGANGKSVFFEVLTALLGRPNVSFFTLQELTNQSGYYRANIGDKLVNYASEISRQMNTAMFNRLASGEPFIARHIYERPIEVVHYAKMIFNANELPKDTEQLHSYFRRLLIIPFCVTIPEAEQDKELHRKIIDNELAGVFNWILAGLKRLLLNKDFTYCQAAADCLEQYRIDSDTSQVFW
jgi:putative DNA primase/helicase